MGLKWSLRSISKASLIEFWSKHPASKSALRTWFEDASRAQWKNPKGIKLRYAKASFLADNRVVFNIKGNDYRLVVAIAYRFGALYIKFIGTHDEYDDVIATTVRRKS